MFRLFRRRKKDKKKEKDIEEKSESKTELPPQPSELVVEDQDNSDIQPIKDLTVAEIPFEERFATIPKIITEPIPEVPDTVEPILDFLPFAETVAETEVSITSFISPELLKPQPEVEQSIPIVRKLTTAELPPITLEERIEGALFSIGRPIHVRELIESFQEESPLVKRTLRKVSRQRKRSSPIIIEEISKDRWVLQLNPKYHEFFQSIETEKFMTPEERRIVTEIAYRQPISLAMVKKIVKKIGPVKITEICRNLEARGYVVGEKRARSLVYTSTPKFAHDFGFDDESRRLKLQMLWRLKRLMGDYEEEPDEKEIDEKLKEEEEREKEEEETVDRIDEEDERELVEEAEIEEESKKVIEKTEIIEDKKGEEEILEVKFTEEVEPETETESE
ncbi:MAG: SMC-Scp complex subunit ScpB [Candidatus Heimdallarchaeota archaeon]|nr:MAG: SMC-Scp complex subunit ScpB [Candidatus Heimdallarchaeota archaeon]